MTTTRSRGQPQPQTLDEMLEAQARRSSIARMGAYALYEKHDARELSERRMATRMRRYRERVDPTGELARRDPQALAKRVEAALKLDMERVRYAKSQRAADRRALQEMLLHTPPDDVKQLAAITAALTMNARGEDLTEQQNETASVEAEAACSPHISGNTQNYVSSDGGTVTIAPTPRRRQTTPPASPKRTTNKKAAKPHGDQKRSHRRDH